MFWCGFFFGQSRLELGELSQNKEGLDPFRIVSYRGMARGINHRLRSRFAVGVFCLQLRLAVFGREFVCPTGRRRNAIK